MDDGETGRICVEKIRALGELGNFVFFCFVVSILPYQLIDVDIDNDIHINNTLSIH